MTLSEWWIISYMRHERMCVNIDYYLHSVRIAAPEMRADEDKREMNGFLC